MTTALVSLPSRQRRQQVCCGTGLVFAAVASLGAWGGSWLNGQVGEQVLMAGPAVLLSVVSAVMARSGLRQRVREKAVVGSQPGAQHTEPGARAGRARLVGAGLLTGALTGFFGVGGGFAVGPAAGGLIGGPVSQRARSSTLTLLFALILAGTAVRSLIALLLA